MNHFATPDFWCDGLAPSAYYLVGARPRIVGVAWIGDNVNPREWEFTLFLPSPVASLEEIEWEVLLPAENMTLWLAFDPDGKRIQIEPSEAVPDPA